MLLSVCAVGCFRVFWCLSSKELYSSSLSREREQAERLGMEVHEHRQKLAHELGVISQLVYKHFSAHRSTKYFQALKKVDRHMYEFSKLKVFDITSCDRYTLFTLIVKHNYML